MFFSVTVPLFNLTVQPELTSILISVYLFILSYC